MFETVIAAMLKHKQVVFAAIAVTALLGYITPPAVQVAQATSFGEDLASGILDSVGLGDNDEEVAAEDVDDDDDDGVDQDLAQDLRQRQEASNEIDQDNEQTQDNDQRNSIETGDNTATNTAVTDNEQDVTAVSGDASAAAEAESEAEDGGSGHHGSKHKKDGHDGHDDGSTSSTAEAAAEAISAADARGTQDNDATAFSTQDSSVHDVTQTNDAHFAPQNNNPVAIAVNDQDQRAANVAAQLGIDLDITSSFTGTGFTNTDD
jgi:hypothetical protein